MNKVKADETPTPTPVQDNTCLHAYMDYTFLGFFFFFFFLQMGNSHFEEFSHTQEKNLCNPGVHFLQGNDQLYDDNCYATYSKIGSQGRVWHWQVGVD